VKSSWQISDLYRWKSRLKLEGLTATLRLELRDFFAPQITLKKPFPLGNQGGSTDGPTRIRQLVDWEVVLAADHVYLGLAEIHSPSYRELQGQPIVGPDRGQQTKKLICKTVYNASKSALLRSGGDKHIIVLCTDTSKGNKRHSKRRIFSAFITK
jgi:hypothetical protein